MKRLLGIDFGQKRIGLAISDEIGQIAFPLCVLENSGWRQITRDINKIINERKVGTLVLGLPLNLDGSKGPAADNVARFADSLGKNTGIPVKLWDERLSTRMAERAMIAGGLSRKRRKQSIDQSTAQIILQSYLDAHANQEVQGSVVHSSGLEDKQDQS